MTMMAMRKRTVEKRRLCFNLKSGRRDRTDLIAIFYIYKHLQHSVAKFVVTQRFCDEHPLQSQSEVQFSQWTSSQRHPLILCSSIRN